MMHGVPQSQTMKLSKPNGTTFSTLNMPKKRVHNWSRKISDVLENIELQNYEQTDDQETHHQEEWMMLSNFFKLNQTNNINLPNANYDWTTDSMKYTAQQIG